MPATNGHTTGATSSHPNGVSHSTRSETPADKPALEAAIEKFDAFKNSFRETLAGMNELTALLRQAVRDQKTGAKEIQTVRQTLRSLQGVKI